MNLLQRVLNVLKKPASVIFVVVVVASLLLAILSYRLVMQSPAQITQPIAKATTTTTRAPTPTGPLKATATPILLPTQSPAKILGIEGTPGVSYPGVSWMRLAQKSCGANGLQGTALKNAIQTYHKQGIRVLLTICQNANDLNNVSMLKDSALSYPDAVQCGNEEMKQDASVSFLYVAPASFAKFYDLCERTMHAVRAGIPVLLGSLDPHVAKYDYQLMVNQTIYLDQMQTAMNTTVHPGGNWDWHNQTLGLIDSWHNDLGVNNLYQVLAFWAQYFNVDLNSGQLGKHIWVVEGTGCFKGCGIDASSAAQVAISHILTLITDVNTSMQYQVPFFFFSGEDFYSVGYYWPIGVLNSNGHPKPLRQDLPMGARTLSLSCPSGSVKVVNQEQLLAELYAHCSLPSDYVDILSS